MEKPKISRFLMIPFTLFEDERVSTGAKMFYGLLASLSNKYGYCFASNDYLADLSKASESQIKRYFKELEDFNYISKEINKSTNERKVFVRFDFADCEMSSAERKNELTSAQKRAQPERKNELTYPYEDNNTYSYPYQSKNTTNNYLEKINITPIAPYEEGAQIPSKFDEFWEAYPRKKDKKKAQALFVRIPDIDNEFPKIMEGLERDKQSQQWNENDGKFIPYPSTWLNRERWKDEGSTKTNKQAFDEWLDPDGTFGGIVKHAFK